MPEPPGSGTAGNGNAGNTVTPGSEISIGVAYGTEKKNWLTDAVRDFAASPEGKGITIDLIPLGSPEAAQAITKGDKRIHVWSPASAAYRDILRHRLADGPWQRPHRQPPSRWRSRPWDLPVLA